MDTVDAEMIEGVSESVLFGGHNDDLTQGFDTLLPLPPGYHIATSTSSAATSSGHGSTHINAVQNKNKNKTKTGDDSLNGHDGNQGASWSGSEESKRDLDLSGFGFDVLKFLDAVKSHLEDRPEVYDDFLLIIKGFKTSKINMSEVVERSSVLLRGHDDLMRMFDTFLPPEYRVTSTSDGASSSRPTSTLNSISDPECAGALHEPGPSTPSDDDDDDDDEFDNAVQFVNKVKARHPEEYPSFLEVLHSYEQEGENVDEIVDKIRALLKDSPDLLAEFMRSFTPVYVE